MKCIGKPLVFLAALLITCPAGAQFPDRPVRLVVPFPPGGALDILARGIAPALEAQLKQPIVVDNRAGANGVIAFDHVARSKPDGYTLLLGFQSGMAVNPVLLPKIPYDPLKDFVAVSRLTNNPSILIVSPSFEAKSVAELVALAKRSPGRISWGAAGSGNPNHIAGELFRSRAGVDMVFVPYKGAAFVITDILGGQLPVAFVTLASAVPHVRSGKVRALAVTSASRTAALPQVVTMAEAGLPEVVHTDWAGIFVPAGTPAAVIARLDQEINRAVGLPEVRARLVEQGSEPMPMASGEFGALVAKDVARMAMVIRQLGLRADQ